MDKHVASAQRSGPSMIVARGVWRAARRVMSPLFARCAVGALTAKSRRIRQVAFEALHKYSDIDLFLCSDFAETYVLNCRDGVISAELFVKGEFEFDKFTLALDLARKQGALNGQLDTLIDIGANIGSVCIPAVARRHASRAIAIEPHPLNCRLLRANVALNGLDAFIEVYESALGDKENETLTLELSSDNGGDHRISVGPGEVQPDISASKSIAVQSTTLDHLVPGIATDRTLIWMDVQGYEGFVLAGADRFLRAKVPLVVEFWPDAMKQAGSLTLLKRMTSGYSGFYNLSAPDVFSPIDRLDELYRILEERSVSTDILLL